MHGIEDITKEWDRSLIFTTPSGSNAIVYEFDLDQPVPLTENKLVLVAKGVTDGLAKAKYAFDSYGVLAEGRRVQVVLRLAESTLAGSLLDAHNAIVEKMGDLGFLVTGQPRVWEITDPEARYFSDQGGIAPLFVNRGGKVGTTKAAVSPNPKQLLVGDIQRLTEAVTLPDPATGLSSQIKVPADTMSTWMKLALAAGVAAATYFAARPAFQNMNPNRRRRLGRLE